MNFHKLLTIFRVDIHVEYRDRIKFISQIGLVHRNIILSNNIKSIAVYSFVGRLNVNRFVSVFDLQCEHKV